MFGLDVESIMGLGYAILIIAFGIITLCTPLFIFRIRNEAIKTNRLLNKVLDVLEGKPVDPNYKTCPACKAKNRNQDVTCLQCGSAI